MSTDLSYSFPVNVFIHTPTEPPPLEEQHSLVVFTLLRGVLLNFLAGVNKHPGGGDSPKNEPSDRVRLLSGERPESGSLSVRLARELGLPLHLILPGECDNASQLSSQAERILALGASGNDLEHDGTYEILNQVAVAFSDLILVVWDGCETMSSSRCARQLICRSALARRPVVWCSPGGDTKFLDISRLDDAHLHHLKNDQHEIEWLKECFYVVNPADVPAEIDKFVALIIDPWTSSETGNAELGKLESYLSDNAFAGWWSGTAGRVHTFFSGLISLDFREVRNAFKVRVFEADLVLPQQKWSSALKPPASLLTRFALSDGEATLAAGRHRDMSWLLYLSSALAVFAAVAGAIHLWPSSHGALWPVLELVVVSTIVIAVWAARKQAWHERWVSHRFMAEQLRYASMGFSALALPPMFVEPFWSIGSRQKREVTLRSAELWLLHRSLVAEGFPQSKTGVFTPTARDNVTELLAKVTEVIEVQIAYHRKNSYKFHKCHVHMHRLSQGLFVATFVAVLTHFVLHAGWLLIFTAFFPSLAAALHGVMVKLEMTRLARQSEKTVESLQQISRSFNCHTLLGESDISNWRFWLHARHLTLEAVNVLSDEANQWQSLMEHQETELPA